MKFKVKKIDLSYLLSFLLIVIFSQITESLWIKEILAAVVFVGLVGIANINSSIHMMCLVGFSTFIFFPAALNGYYFNTGFGLYYSTAFVLFYFLNATKKTIYINSKNNKKLLLVLFLIYSFLVVFFSIAFGGDLVAYVLSPCVMFYALCLKHNRLLYNILILIFFALVFTIYLLFGWSGYGRTVVFGNLIVAILYFIYANELPNNKLLFAIFPALTSTLMVARKEFNFGYFSIYEVLGDSAFGPYRLADTFIENYNNTGIDLFGFSRQILYALTSFVPREFWATKPNAFGSEYVIKNMDQYLVDSGHSIASTLIGDHIYYVGWWGIATGLLMAVIVAKLVNLSYDFKKISGYFVVIFSCNMMVFFWGGMTSFSARMIFPLIGLFPILIIYFIYKKLFKNKILK